MCLFIEWHFFEINLLDFGLINKKQDKDFSIDLLVYLTDSFYVFELELEELIGSETNYPNLV